MRVYQIAITGRHLLAVATACLGSAVAAAETVEFNRHIRPILSENCYACHGFDPKHRSADLRLDTFEGATAEGAIVPGDVLKSIAWQRIISDDPDEVMPPPKSHKPPLSSAQRALLKTWIEQGAKYEKHWAFTPPQKSVLPAEGADHPVDAWVQARLNKEQLPPSPTASPETLIRRVALDLTGLPPTPSEVAAFVTAQSKDPDAAYLTLVERLLRSPHHGERWGRWWLDQARYADSNGYSIDAPRQIWKYRDWVIQALNANMPFDQFTIEQLAGDLLPNATEAHQIATGFHRNTQINQEGGIDKEQFRIDSVFDRVATTGTVWLGLTIGCAQCHDHKFDPIEQKEYYQMFAFFNNQEEPTLKVYDESLDLGALRAEYVEVNAKVKAYIRDHRHELEGWEKRLTAKARKGLGVGVTRILAVPKAKRTPEQTQTLFAVGVGGDGTFRELNDRHKELKTVLDGGVTTLVMKELPKPRKTTLFINGDFTRPDQEVSPATPAVLHALPKQEAQLPNRLDLAQWLVAKDNPLTARVIVNRVWQQYFGRGIVETENDFGLQGTVPSHPELLDWLAVELMEKGWDLRHLHRLIVTSHTYRQTSSSSALLRERDPTNLLLARQSRLRLDAEIVRDVALSASGLLSAKLGGPPVYPPIPPGIMGQGQVKRVWAESKGEDRYRRALYTFIYRASPHPTLTVFDAPDGFSTCTRRLRSNTPLQSLTLLNDAGFFEFATALETIIREQGLAHAFQRCTARQPTETELAVLTKLDPLSAARALLNLDETVTRE
jgi:hypothetical protein